MLLTRLGALALPVIIVTAACGSAQQPAVAVDATASCPAPVAIAPSAVDAANLAAIPAGSLQTTINDPANIAFFDLLGGQVAAAILRVDVALPAQAVAGDPDAFAAGRGLPLADASAEPTDALRGEPAPSAPATSGFRVVRPTSFHVVRRIRGELPTCVAYEVPGGLARGLESQVDNFPRDLTSGQQVLALFGSSITKLDSMFVVSKDGFVSVPWSDTPIAVDKL